MIQQLLCRVLSKLEHTYVNIDGYHLHMFLMHAVKYIYIYGVIKQNQS